jgi:hypothetical protein
MPKGSNNLTLLPSMLSSSKSKYLSMLYSALYASEEPFQHFVKTSGMFLKISWKAFKHVWPHLKVTLQTDDALFNVVSLFTIVVDSRSIYGSNLIFRAISVSLKSVAGSTMQ